MQTIRATKIVRTIQGALSDGYTTISAQGSSRSGKTYNILIFLIAYLLGHRGLRLSIVRGTLPALKGSAMVDFKDIMLRLDLYDKKAFNKSDLVYTFPNGSTIDFFSTDNEQKLRDRKSVV